MVKAKELQENEKLEVTNAKKVELKKNDSDQLMMRDRIIGGKQAELQKLQLEIQMLSREAQLFHTELFKKYDLPTEKNYVIKGGFLEEVVSSEE